MFFCNQIKCLKRGAVPVFPGLFSPTRCQTICTALEDGICLQDCTLSIYTHIYIIVCLLFSVDSVTVHSRFC